MGSSQSKRTELPTREQLAERLAALDLKLKQQESAPVYGLEKGHAILQQSYEAPPSYGPPSEHVSIAAVQQWEKGVLSDPKNRLAMSAFTSNPATSIISSRAARIADTQTFNIKINLEGSPVTNQRSSGRCWLFASTNVFRIAMMKKYNLASFELSQSYLFFWDKMEKTNYFLENILDTLDEPLDGRLLQELMKSPVGDGGQWDMVANLVEKWGLIPQTLYPDSYNAMNSSAMGSLITTKLREDAVRLRNLAVKSKDFETVAAAKRDMMEEIYRILVLMLGPTPRPDEDFTWEYYDKDKKYHKLTTTPIKFSAELSDSTTVRACGGTDVHHLFSLVNDPRNKMNSLLTVDRLGNVWKGRPVIYVNVDMHTIKAACIAQLKAGIPVFFGSDVGKYSDGQRGIMDTALLDWELGFNVKLGMSKAERLQTGESAMTHAMVLTAVQVEDGKSVRWRVENSWSEDRGEKGYFVMSDAWMDEFVYQAVVDPKFVSKAIRGILEQQPHVLPLWDPMGALA